MSKRKSCRYDPMAVKAKIAKREKAAKELETLGLQFLSAVNDIDEENLQSVMSCFTNDSVVELALNYCSLGIEGNRSQ